MDDVNQSGLARIGRRGEAGALVSFDVSLDVEGEALTAFVGVLRPLEGGGLSRFYGGPAFLTLLDGPTIEIVIVSIDDDAVFQLAPPFHWPRIDPAGNS